MDDYSQFYESAGQQYNIHPDLLRAIVQVESGGNPNAVSSAGAKGPAQLLPETAASLGIEDPKDPQQAIYGAAKLLDQNMTRYGNVDDAVRAYHGGTDQRNWGPKTKAYHDKVMSAFSGGSPATLMAQSQAATSLTDEQLLSGIPDGMPLSGSHALSDDELLSGIPDYGSTAQPQAPQRLSQDFGVPGRVGMGIAQGGVDIGHTALNAIDAGTNALLRSPIALTAANALFPGAGVIAAMTAPTESALGIAPQQRAYEQARFKQLFGDSTAAKVGRIAGQTAMTAPIVGAGLPAIGSVSPLAASYLGLAANTARGIPIVGPLAVNALTGATQGAGAAALTSGGNSEVPLSQQLSTGAKIGGLFGAAAPVVQKVAGKIYNALTGAGSVSPAAIDLAQSAVDQFGIPIRGSQITSNPFIRRLDTFLGNVPFSGMKESNEEISDNFYKAVASSIGATEKALTPDVALAAKKAIGNKFDQVAQNVGSVKADNQFVNDLATAEQEARGVLTSDQFSPIKHQVDSILEKIAADGTIDWKAYQAITNHDAPLDRVLNSENPNIAFYASKIRNALDEALSRSAKPEDQALLTEAKYQYKNLKTLEPLLAKAPEGFIRPQLLLNRVQQIYGNVAMGGGGDLGILGRIAERFLKPASSSGAAENLGIGGLLAESGAAVAHPGLIPRLIAGTAGTIGAGRLAGSSLRSDWYRNMLMNQAAQAAAPSTTNMLLRNTAIPAAVSASQSLPLPIFLPSTANAY